MRYKNAEEKSEKKKTTHDLTPSALHHLEYPRICLKIFTFFTLALPDECPAPSADLGLPFNFGLGAWVDARVDVFVNSSVPVQLVGFTHVLDCGFSIGWSTRKILERNGVNFFLRNVQWETDLGHPKSECGIDFVESDHLLAETLKGVRVEIGEWETISRYFL